MVGVCLQVLQECKNIPILGVCLGHQALGFVNGAKVVHAPEPVHGRISEIEHIDCPLFSGIPSGKGSGFQVVRYHSLILDSTSLPEELVPTAWTISSSCISSIQHQSDYEDSQHSFQRPDIWTCEPSRLQNTVKPCAVPDTRISSKNERGMHLAKDISVSSDGGSDRSVTTSDDECKSAVIMAISHRERPHYGVQFHPESIGTSFGKQILENFRDITLSHWQRTKAKMAVTRQIVSEDFHPLDGSLKIPLRMYWEKVEGIVSAAGGSESIFCGLFGEGTAKDTFWLDSALQTGGARFSFMGGRGGKLWKRLTYCLSDKHGSGGGILRIEDSVQVEEKVLDKGFLDFFSRELELYKPSEPDSVGLPFDFWGGFVGYLGYELKVECGARLNQHKSKLPDACYFFIDRFIAVDHLTNDVYAVVLYTDTPDGNLLRETLINGKSVHQDKHKVSIASVSSSSNIASSSNISSQTLLAQLWVRDILQRVHGLAEQGRDMSVERRYSSQLASCSLGSKNTDTHFVIAKSKKQYMEDVQSCLKYIKDGESYELCLTTQLQKRVGSFDALGLYLTLRKMNPAPYAAWLHFGPEEVCICCSSPERFLRLDQNGMIEAKPIKGTIPRGRSHAEDEALRRKLQYSEKDQAENLMIVDLLRNDLGRVCKPGTVHVPSLMAVESYATVHTMVSTIRGIKRSDVTALDCVRASFPGGSMTGAPKLRSMELLDSLECSPRGVYSGSVGFFSVNSAFDLNIVIRTLVIHKGIASLGAGGAIVSLSDPADEYEEMLLKTKAPIKAVSCHEALSNHSSQDIESESLPHALLGLH
ncbi:hypothetical protein KP509_14G093500 [Ceratopteris richardii]|uniref:aminodeoxychorismate synthase n=1 Tax=Ceratopteris richardii TaxID=49495 RepID=A0A8T2TEB9_CERRI|nr:hypothetical protein KP509_14G093500 [Ceratopteris richardii]